MDIVVSQGSIIEADADVIVTSTNSKGSMVAGVSGVIRKSAGLSVESEAMEKAPIAVGTAILTSAGSLPFMGVIHAAILERLGAKTPGESIYKATAAALRLAQENGFQSVALPGMGTGLGGLEPDAAAHQMIAAIRDVAGSSLELILLIDISAAMVEAWEAEIARGEKI